MSLGVAAVGLLVGFLLGLTSLGGGSLLTPMLVLVLRVHPVVAVGSDLAFQAVTRMTGLAVHARQRSIDRSVLVPLAIGSVPGTLATGLLIATLHIKVGHDRAIVVALGIALLITAVTLALGPGMRSDRERARSRASRLSPTARRVVTVAAGFAIGACVTLTSVGAGSLVMALLVLMYPGLSGRRLVGTDFAHGVILLPISAAIALSAGNVDLGLVGGLLAGSVPGVIVGSRLSMLIPERPLRLTVAGVIFLTGLRLLPIGV